MTNTAGLPRFKISAMKTKTYQGQIITETQTHFKNETNKHLEFISYI